MILDHLSDGSRGSWSGFGIRLLGRPLFYQIEAHLDVHISRGVVGLEVVILTEL